MTHPEARVLHINDAAFTTTVLMAEARRRGLPWRYLPLASLEGHWKGLHRVVRRGLRGARWEAGLARLATTTDVLHVHVASVARHTAWVPRRYVLHLHGTDIRSHQYDPRYRSQVRRALQGAAAVLYSTPDLAPHIPEGIEATLFPVPLDTAALPAWTPHPQPRVVFSSRWDDVKGATVQLAVARLLHSAFGKRVELVGVDWGPLADEARRAGVLLLPRSSHDEYVRLLASAHVVVGQPTGMLAASELEALGIGVPTVTPIHTAWYQQAGAPLPPVLGGTDLDIFRLPPQDPNQGDPPLTQAEVTALAKAITATVALALDDPAAAVPPATGANLTSPQTWTVPEHWVAQQHGAAVSVDKLVPLYRRLIHGREN
ncbi:MAG: hypothetical protein ACK5LN_13510 [Propioniciclava sp.]